MFYTSLRRLSMFSKKTWEKLEQFEKTTRVRAALEEAISKDRALSLDFAMNVPFKKTPLSDMYVKVIKKQQQELQDALNSQEEDKVNHHNNITHTPGC